MNTFMWDTPEKLRALLCELVSWESRTLTEGENKFAFRLKDKLLTLPYFEKHPDLIELHDAGLGRNAVTAFYKHPTATETVVLISHFDTVHTEEYGELEPLAFSPEELTKKLMEPKYLKDLPEAARIDLASGNYLFGRGTMDMKMGLALHMQLIEKASFEQWPINLILTTVPDEEVNSAGMRAAVVELVRLREQHGLTYKLFLNSEPSFSQGPSDTNEYIYSGTIGKIMPAALFYGKETHVGEPLKGMTAPFIASYMTQHMEWNPLFRETDLGESTPLPVSLQLKDLKMEYSTQTPYRAAALYNVFLLKRTAAEVMAIFEEVALQAMAACNAHYQDICTRENVQGVGKVKVLRYEALLEHAIHKLGAEEVQAIKHQVQQHPAWDDREKSIRIVDQLMIRCQELAPATVLLYAPPYYPAINSSNHPLVKQSIELMKQTAQTFDIEVEQIHYFNGICDLSYVNYSDASNEWLAFERNTPVWGDTYHIPFKEMAALQGPVLNVGPFGKDAHQKTERLHVDSAFKEMPVMIDTLIKSLF
ncbi:amino acid degradation protein [Lysinibacillus sp. YS11]|uniref:M20/M25/M40 family metallo-hydrolase n=12 Tax=Lysinibacillus TaxID=400634 RepID=A0ABY8KIU2_9BACI|nr:MULTISPECIES: M20/M25/M40 family metallo-hydrolase [Lysinibacillus]AUS85690.1 amino acid degradation protein [Lysinibacillus sp. YS11]MDP1393124.1 M20/M25/M40 family metallo-hydrolase [Lysinibacillus capsici]MDP1413598.1 M20/M25/M40 family metallo-hydrolase [Lysinibacillus capsici]MDP1429465.1 M20/M25/M40 family metallo-hydrolase [Lysinibacillus capsici]WGF37979.1 M20/M25/M40 family metallo-hydrolase [Lysinibacillus capsici]